jgi:hypothetical protein
MGLQADRTHGELFDSLHGQYHQRVYNDLLRRLDRLNDTSGNTTIQQPTSDMKAFAHDGITIEAFPNPYSGSTELRIRVGKSDYLRLEVLDVLGNMILSENLGHRNSGIHKYNLNSSNWAAGVYYARLVTQDGKVQTVKLVRE